MSNVGEEPGEGHSVAAWTSVVIMLVAILGGTVTFWFDIPWLVWSFAGLLVVGALLWPILTKAGLGEKPHSHGA